MFASASYDRTIRIWKQDTFECIRVLTDHTDAFTGLVVLENGYFVSISDDKTAIVWDCSTFTKITTLSTENPLSSISSFFENSFITGNNEGTIQIWFPVLLSWTKTLSIQNNTVTDLAVLKNGFLASSSFDGKIHIWDNSYKSTVKEAHSNTIVALKVFANGSLISCSTNGICKTWDTDQFILTKTIYKEN
jgi:WD40 repeat protein